MGETISEIFMAAPKECSNLTKEDDGDNIDQKETKTMGQKQIINHHVLVQINFIM